MKHTLLLLFLCFSALLKAQHMDRIQEAMANYDYETALTLIDQKEQTVPLLLQKGKALRGLGLNREALSTYQEVIYSDTTNTCGFIEAADCCRKLAQYNQALKYYEQAIRLAPKNKYAHIQYITLLLSQEKYQKALKESNVMTETDSSATVLHLQAQCYEGMKQISSAIDCYRHIQDKYPLDYLSAAKLGALYVTDSSYDKALEVTEKYRQIDTTNIAINRLNALAYCLKKDYPNAIRRYKYLVSQGDNAYFTCFYLGISYYAVEKYYEAHDALEVAYRYEPENIDLLYYLGRACAKTSWKKQGVEHLEKAINLAIPKDSMMSRLYIGMADCYKMSQMYKEQIGSIKERYQKYDKENHKLLYDIAYIYFHNLKDKKNTERYLEAFLKTHPKNEKENQTEEYVQEGRILGEASYYNAAANWLKDLQNKQKIEDFFQNGKPMSTGNK
ncbi:tetratricopeptide repeat protein [Bacteroides sp.]|uniref:tetratricopeptide repeat protein n=1 Tax=Bacteroides sp. TaxID=29523 RepID=UPI00262C9CCA|nr:tetratricopeptide repeat protein [Bacteroides sp.]MDD3040176.1 tetratricopeptide repeat protein [Bacteroides sp.]